MRIVSGIYRRVCLDWSINPSDQQEYSLVDLNPKPAEFVDTFPNLLDECS